jgi:hypothetical protein
MTPTLDICDLFLAHGEPHHTIITYFLNLTIYACMYSPKRNTHSTHLTKDDVEVLTLLEVPFSPLVPKDHITVN